MKKNSKEKALNSLTKKVAIVVSTVLATLTGLNTVEGTVQSQADDFEPHRVLRNSEKAKPMPFLKLNRIDLNKSRLVANHASHRSHSSHRSHASHYSHYSHRSGAMFT